MECGLYHLKALQIALQVKDMIKRIRARTTIRQHIEDMIRWAQHCTGTGFDILQTHTDIPYLEGPWVANLRQDLATIKGSLVQLKKWHRPPTRENNTYIMDNFRKDH
eukprot:1260449-Ditylum_brightwellii.AAC.1